MANQTRPDACLLCATEGADEADIVFRDELWAAEVVAGYEVPGWVILRARRHAERLVGLSSGELDVFAYRLRDLVAAVSEVMAAPTTYQLVFGENYKHFHVLVAARGEDVPVDRRGGDLLKLRTESADPVAARQRVPALRDAYAAALQKSAADMRGKA